MKFYYKDTLGNRYVSEQAGLENCKNMKFRLQQVGEDNIWDIVEGLTLDESSCSSKPPDWQKPSGKQCGEKCIPCSGNKCCNPPGPAPPGPVPTPCSPHDASNNCHTPAPSVPTPAPGPLGTCTVKGEGKVTYEVKPWNCHAMKSYTIPSTYKGIWRGSDVNSGANIQTMADYNTIIAFNYAAAPSTQFKTLFRGDPPYTQSIYDTYINMYCTNNCTIGNKNANIISWNTGGGVAPNWSGSETTYIINMIPILIQLGYNGLSLDIEYVDSDFTPSMIESIATAAKKCKLHFSITVMGWGPQPTAPYSWEGLDFTNIDVFIPQCYGSRGKTYPPDSDSSPEKICKYWVDGICPNPPPPSGAPPCRANFTPCKVPPEKLAAGLADTTSYSDNVKLYAKAGYFIWGSLWSPDWNECNK